MVNRKKQSGFIESVKRISPRRIVSLPLSKLFDESGNDLPAIAMGSIKKRNVASRISAASCQLVVARLNCSLQFVPPKDSEKFWREIEDHIAEDPDSGFELDAYPNATVYVATEWEVPETGKRYIVFEVHH